MRKAGSTEPKDQRVPLMMTRSELKALDDWSFARRIRSRGEAIRQLVKLGLTASSEAQQPAEESAASLLASEGIARQHEEEQGLKMADKPGKPSR